MRLGCSQAAADALVHVDAPGDVQETLVVAYRQPNARPGASVEWWQAGVGPTCQLRADSLGGVLVR